MFAEKWVDAEGNHWYKIRVTNWACPSKAGLVEGFMLVRISASGKILEGVFSQTGYPTEVSSLGSKYGISYKR
ncbi:MAG: hypothetical protein IMZ69_12360 [Spirochaetes bacterium]|nr:hypothetical protein [Spirochaetota bacterium]